MQLHEAKAELQAANILVKIVVFDEDFMAKSYVNNSGIDFPLLLDKKKEIYAAYGMQRGSWW